MERYQLQEIIEGPFILNITEWGLFHLHFFTLRVLASRNSTFLNTYRESIRWGRKKEDCERTNAAVDVNRCTDVFPSLFWRFADRYDCFIQRLSIGFWNRKQKMSMRGFGPQLISISYPLLDSSFLTLPILWGCQAMLIYKASSSTRYWLMDSLNSFTQYFRIRSLGRC